MQAIEPERDKLALIVEAFDAMWCPITATPLTTETGFIGVYFAAYIPAFIFFGQFTALGVAIARVYSLIFLPVACKHMQKLAKSE